mgnify:CR=1 FL=1
MNTMIKQRISDEKLNQFALTEFGVLPTSGPMPAQVFYADDTLSVEQRMVNISEKCYGQRCDINEDGKYMAKRLMDFLK